MDKKEKLQLLLDKLEALQNQSEDDTNVAFNGMIKNALDTFAKDFVKENPNMVALRKFNQKINALKLGTKEISDVVQQIQVDISESEAKILEEFATKIQETWDKISKEVSGVRDELETRFDTLSMPDVAGPLTSLRKEFESRIEALNDGELKKDIESIQKQMQNMAENSIETKDELEKAFEKRTEEKLKKLRIDFLARIANAGHGGQANRNITMNGQSVLGRYTDINFLNSSTIGWIATNDDVRKWVNFSASILSGGGGGTPGGSNTQLQYNNNGAFGGISGATSDGTNTTFKDANLTIVDDADPTKIAQFQVSTLSPGTTRTYTFPSVSMIFAGSNIANSWSAQQTLTNDSVLAFGTIGGNNEPGIVYNTAQTPDAGMFLTGATSNSWIIAENSDKAFDFAHAQATDPTLFIHSHNQSTSEWSSFSNNGTNGIISSGEAMTVVEVAALFRQTPGSGQGFLTLTGTLPSSAGQVNDAFKLQISTAGTGGLGSYQIGTFVNLLGGFTGLGQTAGTYSETTAAGTGTAVLAAVTGGNFGSENLAAATTVGTNVGGGGWAEGGNVNYGLLGRAVITKNSATNIGVAGFAVNGGSSPITVGGFFGLMSALPTYASAALIADNGAVAADIFVARDNGTAVFTVADGGPTTLAVGTLASTVSALTITGTLNSAGVPQTGVSISITGSGSTASSSQRAGSISLLAGYTGTAATAGLNVTNASAGTDNVAPDINTVFWNSGVRANSFSAGTGTMAGIIGLAAGMTRNIGGYFLGISAGTTSAVNIGVMGQASVGAAGGSPIQVGGYFGLYPGGTAMPTFASAALMADNGVTTSDIFVARDNGTAVFTIADGGAVTATALITSAGLTSSGVIQTTGGQGIIGSGNITVAAGSTLFFSTRTGLTSPSDGVLTIWNNAQNNFTRLNFGGTTSSFPALGRSTAFITQTLADGTAGGGFMMTGLMAQYNNVTTAGWGIPAIYSAGRATAQTAANASVATYTCGAADGSFEVSANVLVTTSSAESFTVTVSYTDEGNTARTLTLNFQTIAGVIGTTVAFANGAVPYEGILTHLRVKASTAITIKTAAGGTYTGCTYNVEGIIKQTA